jgi:hypothetical protein
MTSSGKETEAFRFVTVPQPTTLPRAPLECGLLHCNAVYFGDSFTFHSNHLHSQGWKLSQVQLLLVSCLAYPSILWLEAINSHETSGSSQLYAVESQEIINLLIKLWEPQIQIFILSRAGVTLGGIVDWIYWPLYISLLVTTGNYSAIVNLHTLHITTTHSKSFSACCVFFSLSLVTASNSADSWTHAITTLPAGFQLRRLSHLFTDNLPTENSCN